MRTSLKITTLLATTLFALAVTAPDPATAVGNDPPKPVPSQSSAPKGPAKAKKKSTKKKKSDKRSEQKFLKDYSSAYATIYKDHDYAGGIDALKALHRDDHPDVANLIGFSSRKLGRYDDAKHWYEKALAADPKHARTWSYYGMWHAEQGNVLKARDYLAKVETICGTGCKEYVELKEVIEGTRVY